MDIVKKREGKEDNLMGPWGEIQKTKYTASCTGTDEDDPSCVW
jgi:hypothetical protein